VLNLAGNRIASFDELELLFTHCKGIEAVDLRGNPVCREVKYRERVIVMGTFAELDEKEVLETQREMLKRLGSRKPQPAKRPPQKKEQAPLRVKHLKS
jgi:protein phosphatase 1 regulatory subunit 42